MTLSRPLCLVLFGVALIASHSTARVHAQDAQVLYQARERFIACRERMEKGQPCEAVKECERGLELHAIDVLVSLTKDARRACRVKRNRARDPQDVKPDPPPDPIVEAAVVLSDSDLDGIADDVDPCPLQREDGVGDSPEDGCPELDDDHDGVQDEQDACQLEPEDPDGFEDGDGCPDLDNDSDGITDVWDACPNTPEDGDDFKDDDGCPDLDNDNDGITDAWDACPNLAEDLDANEDTDGCPESEIGDEVWITLGVGGGLLIVGGVIEALALVEKQAIAQPEKQDGFVEGMSQEDARDRLSSANTLEAVGLTTLGLGGALVVTSLVLWWVGDDDVPASVGLAPSHEGFGVWINARF